MKKAVILSILAALPLAALLSCSSNDNPTAPHHHWGTPTPSLSSSVTPVVSATHTSTPTVTKTPVCPTYFSFGKNSLGSGTLEPSAGVMVANKFNLGVGGNLFRLNAYVASVATPTTLQMAVYTDNSGAPQSLVAQSVTQAAQAGWNVLDLPQTVLAPGDYWIAVSSSQGVDLSEEDGANGDGYYVYAGPGSLPSVFSGSPVVWGFSLYADYCAVAGSPTPVPTATFTPTVTPTVTLTVTPTDTPACSSSFSFGRNYVGGHTQEIDNGTAASQFILTVGGTVSTLHVYVAGNTGTSVKMGLYSDGGSAPGTLITGSGPQVVSSGWNSFAVPGTFVPAGTYWIAAGSLAGSNGPQFAADTGSDGSDPNDGYLTSGLIPPSFSGAGPFQFSLSAYADYCVSGTSPTPMDSPTKTFTPTYTPTATATPTETVSSSCNGTYSFGRNYSPSGAVSWGLNDGTVYSKFTLPVAGKVSRLHAYVVSAGGNNFEMGLYSDGGSAPGTLISGSGSQAAVNGWNSVGIPGTAELPAGAYWIAAAANAPSTAIEFAADDYSVDSDPNDGYITGFTLIPATASASGPFQESAYFYADYCVQSGSPTPVFSPTQTFTVTNTVTPTVTVTQTPVCSSPSSFGVSVIQSNSTFSSGNMFATRFVLSSAAQVVGLHAYIAAVSSPTHARMAFYTDNAGLPGTLLTQSNSEPVTADSWNYFAVPSTSLLSAPATYWIALTHDNNSYPLGLSATAFANYPDPGDGFFGGMSYGPFPATAPSGSSQDYTFSFYADKCP